MSEWGKGMGMTGSKEGMEMNGVDPWREKASWIHGGKKGERIHGGKTRRVSEYARRIHGGKRLSGSMETGRKQELQSCKG